MAKGFFAFVLGVSGALPPGATSPAAVAGRPSVQVVFCARAQIPARMWRHSGKNARLRRWKRRENSWDPCKALCRIRQERPDKPARFNGDEKEIRVKSVKGFPATMRLIGTRACAKSPTKGAVMRGNSVSIKGNLTRNAEWRDVNGGKRTCASFGLAWNARRPCGNGEYETIAHFFEVDCWMSDRQAKWLRGELVKGATCSIIDGSLAYDVWTAKDGGRRSRVGIVVADPIGGMHVSPPRAMAAPAADDDQDDPALIVYGAAGREGADADLAAFAEAERDAASC
ncbi:single-stranded DNA-binding protein [Eggerthellaceae bacterium zg-893]|nr:single-stranded DNA-binding protein [Eggerthellaceae bacterium zg-893]